MTKPFQGVLNIIRFNWHFYIIAFSLVLLLLLSGRYLGRPFQTCGGFICILIVVTTVVSLLVSFYVYDLSGLYRFNWLNNQNTPHRVVNIHAGFDETSFLLKKKFPVAVLITLDFYNPSKHTEISIRRARKSCSPYPGTTQVETTSLPLADDSADKIFVTLAAHEIRNDAERTAFFKELYRVVKPTGQIFITEHLRDTANFLAYNIGFLHFYTKASWYKTFHTAGLKINGEIKLTPFISAFILDKNGNTL